MKLPKWFRRWILKEKPRAIFDREVLKNPLREFIYLDEVSLQSLLSSKNGEMTSSTSTENYQSVETESQYSANVATTGIGKAGMGLRYQTQNSSTLQTAKKATVQSWFRELDKVPNLRKVETIQEVQAFADNKELLACDNHSVCMHGDQLLRGDVVEFRVRLAADPIFHLVTIVSEMKAMAEDYPTMMAGNGGMEQFGELDGISKVLQRLLAGLVPVRAQVIDYVVVVVENHDYLVHIDAIKELDIEHKPLEIGCVTELDAYWKDIRRVLFSEGEFTILSRVAQSGLKSKWTPVKLADLLGQLAPDLEQKIDDAARIMFDATKRGAQQHEQSSSFATLLENYTKLHIEEIGLILDETQRTAVEQKNVELGTAGKSVSEQTAALKNMAQFLSTITDREIDAKKALQLRDNAREASAISYLEPSKNSPKVSRKDNKMRLGDRFLDVEVIAMYW